MVREACWKSAFSGWSGDHRGDAEIAEGGDRRKEDGRWRMDRARSYTLIHPPSPSSILDPPSSILDLHPRPFPLRALCASAVIQSMESDWENPRLILLNLERPLPYSGEVTGTSHAACAEDAGLWAPCRLTFAGLCDAGRIPASHRHFRSPPRRQANDRASDEQI
jgi:hypothetical protein